MTIVLPQTAVGGLGLAMLATRLSSFDPIPGMGKPAIWEDWKNVSDYLFLKLSLSLFLFFSFFGGGPSRMHLAKNNNCSSNVCSDTPEAHPSSQIDLDCCFFSLPKQSARILNYYDQIWIWIIFHKGSLPPSSPCSKAPTSSAAQASATSWNCDPNPPGQGGQVNIR